ncbi:hypothetical protein PHYSODRAFT_492424, partial [Phytophthora sojae]
RNKMALYASVTGIRWDFSEAKIAGADIHVPAKQHIARFEISPASDFTVANALWDKIDEAFSGANDDL